ncbi:MAG: PEGA domain-containing protein [Nannocystaceae bacterium]
MARRRRRRPPFAAVAAVAVVAGSGMQAAAAPDAQRRAALLPLQVEGDLSPGWRDQIEQDLGRGLISAGMEIAAAEAVLQASGGVGDCSNAKCFQFLADSANARFLVRTRVAVADRSYSITMDIFDGEDGSLAASSRESCELCGLSEVGELVTTQAAALRKKLDVLTLEPAVLAVISVPSGATIVVDGEEIGKAPLEHELAPGPHRAQARKRGYVDQSRSLDAVVGVRETITFELMPADAGKDERRGVGDWNVPAGWTLLGVGVAGLATGVTFLVLDEAPYQAQCSGPDVDAQGNCRQRYGTLGHGIGFTAAGGALLVTGAALLIAARVGKGRAAATTAKRLRLGPGTIGARF